MYKHNALGNRSGLALCLTKVRSSRACYPATALIIIKCQFNNFCMKYMYSKGFRRTVTVSVSIYGIFLSSSAQYHVK